MRDLKEFCALFISFIPWLLFLFLSGHSLSSLKVAIIVSLLATLVFGIHDLRRSIILTWATLIFFMSCAIFINLLGVVWLAKNMEILAKSFLASVMWFTWAVGQPFVLQYARRGLPKDQWNQPKLLLGCRFLTLVWAWLMSLAVAVAILRRSSLVNLPEWVYFDAGLVIIFTGLIITTLFKRQKRIQRQKAGLKN